MLEIIKAVIVGVNLIIAGQIAMITALITIDHISLILKDILSPHAIIIGITNREGKKNNMKNKKFVLYPGKTMLNQSLAVVMALSPLVTPAPIMN